MLPTFLLIGTAKSGTNTLFTLLKQHPDVGLASSWEPNFFAYDHLYAKGLPYYENFFEHCAQKKAIGEKSWRYSVKNVFPLCRERIAKHLPEAKLIYMVRQPLERVRSLWIEFRSSGYPMNVNFNRAVREDPIFVDSTRYGAQLATFRDLYSEDNILVIFFEEFVANQYATLGTVCDFLGVRPVELFDTVKANSSEGKLHDTPIAQALRRLPLFAEVRERTPSPLRNGLRRMLKQEVQRPEWDCGTREWFLGQISSDCEIFLKEYGKPSGYWDV